MSKAKAVSALFAAMLLAAACSTGSDLTGPVIGPTEPFYPDEPSLVEDERQRQPQQKLLP